MERVKEQNQNPKQIHPKNTAESDDWHRRDVGHLLITKRTELWARMLLQLNFKNQQLLYRFRHAVEYMCFSRYVSHTFQTLYASCPDMHKSGMW